MFDRIVAWWKDRQRPLTGFSILLNDSSVTLVAADVRNASWNREFSWADIRRVCFQDGGLLSSDLIIIQLADPNDIVTIPTEGDGGQDLWVMLIERGFVPEHVWRKAAGDTSGGIHCWPPMTNEL